PVEKLWQKPFFSQIKKIPGRPAGSLDSKLVGLSSYRGLRKQLVKRSAMQASDRPCLIIWGRGDQFLWPLKLEQWREIFQNAESIELDCSHWPMFERPDEFNSALEKFLVDDVEREA